jgi:hypothetical protein
MRAEFSMVGSALNQGRKAMSSSPVAGGDVVEVVEVVEVVDVVDVVEQVKFELLQPPLASGYP